MLAIAAAPPEMARRAPVAAICHGRIGGGFALAAVLAAIDERVGWAAPGRDALDSFVFPLTHYSIVLAGWSLCYFWIHAQLAEQAEHRHAVRAEAEALRAELEKLRLQL